MFRLFYVAVIALLVNTITGCSEPESPSSVNEWIGGDSSDYQTVVKGKTLEFPQDHAAHPGFRQEWWYLTANLQDEHGEEIGLQWTQFRLATQARNGGSDSAWSTNQIYMAHTGMTTLNTHLADEKWSREHPELAYIQTAPFSARLDDWVWQSQSDDLFPATLDVRGEVFSYHLSMDSRAPYQAQGANGYSTKSRDGTVASYYYSQPFIDVTGTIEILGEIKQVQGVAWLDREWSSQFLTDSQQGWDWFALRLDQDTALMAFQLRPGSGEEAPFFSARLMRRDGTGQNIDSDEISMSPVDWVVIDERQYPVVWRIEIPVIELDLEIHALNPNAKMPLSVPYWEGPVSFSGTHTGEGYMELTGY